MLDFKHVSRYVAGACTLETPAPARPRDTMRITAMVWEYLNGVRQLDASCSDFERELTLDAAQLFGGPAQARRIWELAPGRATI